MASAKTKVRLHFEETQRPRAPSGMLRPLSGGLAMETHRQVSQAETENVGVESRHRAEQTVESAKNGVQRAHRSRKLKAHRQSVLAERQLDQANIYCLQKKGAGNRLSVSRSHPASRPEISYNGNPLSRWQQKHAIKREYAMLCSGKGVSSMGSSVKAGQTVTETAAQAANNTGKALSMAAEKLLAFVSHNSSGIMTALGVFLLMALVDDKKAFTAFNSSTVEDAVPQDPVPTIKPTPEPEKPSTPTAPEPTAKNYVGLGITAILFIGGGAFLYSKLKSGGKKTVKGVTHLDEYDFGMDDDLPEPETESEAQQTQDKEDDT